MSTRGAILAASMALLGSIMGCAGPAAIRGRGDYCAPPTTPVSSAAPVHFRDGAPRDENTAVLLGLGALALAPPGRPLSVEARLHVVAQIDRARLAISASVSELDCEAGRAREAADYLARAKSEKVQSLTIASVAAAAATGIAGTLLSTSNASNLAQNTVAISGGALTAGLALSSLYVNPKVLFMHDRNLLTDVWKGPATSTSYGSVVWTYLTRVEFSNSRVRSIRANLVERWRHFERVDEDRALQGLLLGTGGLYDDDTLRMRAAMLDEVKAEVSLANQDIADLIEHLLGRETTAP